MLQRLGRFGSLSQCVVLWERNTIASAAIAIVGCSVEVQSNKDIRQFRDPTEVSPMFNRHETRRDRSLGYRGEFNRDTIQSTTLDIVREEMYNVHHPAT